LSDGPESALMGKRHTVKYKISAVLKNKLNLQVSPKTSGKPKTLPKLKVSLLFSVLLNHVMKLKVSVLFSVWLKFCNSLGCCYVTHYYVKLTGQI
jgi:hypothetical protein